MKTFDELNRPTGTLHLMAKNENGIVLWRSTSRNMIVSSGYNSVAQALAGVPDQYIKKIAIGTNGMEPQTTDSEITDAVFFDIESVEYPTPETVRFRFTINYTDAVDMLICEFGLICADGRLFARKTREPIEKTKLLTITGMWEINL